MTEGPERPGTGIAGPVAATIIVLLGFAPIVNWLAGGRSADWYHNSSMQWLSGTAIVAGVAVVLTILSRKLSALWWDGLLSRRLGPASPSRASISAIAAGGLALYIAIAWYVFAARPLLIDEIVQLMQARMYLSGHLWAPTVPHPEFVSVMHVVDTGAKTYSQFPPGGAAMLAIGELLHLPWLVGPVCGAISILLFGALLRLMEDRPAVRLGALLLFTVAPLVAFMAGTYMNHVPTLMWLLVGILGLVHAMTAEGPRPGWALLAGLGFGAAATIRPLDGAVFALPAAIWFLVAALRRRARWRDALSAALGVALPIALLLWVNWRTTGAPLLFAYEVLWGKDVGLGFHIAPWGGAHTPRLGLELVNLYLLRLQTYLYELPIPSLLPVAGALALAPKLKPADRYLLATGALLLTAYWAYWFDGFYLGPRFLYPLAPLLVLWTARFPGLVRDRLGPKAHRVVIFGAIAAFVMGWSMLLPIRMHQYRHGLITMRWNADSAASQTGVEGALVLVRESWGAQLIARMWALGVSRTDAERLYRGADACAVDYVVSGLEARNDSSGLPPEGATAALRPLLSNPATAVHTSPFASTSDAAHSPRIRYSPRCLRRLQEDSAGYLPLAPLQLFSGGDNLYVRDLHARDTILLRKYPDRPVYLLTEDPYVGAMPEFHRAPRDSIWAAAGRE